MWIKEANLSNLPLSKALNVTDVEWPAHQIQALFTANSLHIMHWKEVECLFERLRFNLAAQATVCI